MRKNNTVTHLKTAILVDGGFYRRRAQSVFGDKTAEERAVELTNSIQIIIFPMGI